MGAAYTALATDAYAPIWNPGGLGMLESSQLAGQHLSYLESIHYEYLSFVYPLPTSQSCPSVKSCHNMGLGASIQYLGSGDITGLDKDGDPIGDFSSHYAAYSLAFGMGWNEKFSLGVTGKLIDAKISDVGAQAYAADVAGMYRPKEKLTLAGGVVNLGTKLTFLRDGGDLPLAFRVGTAYQPTNRWNLAAEGVYRKTGLASGHFGVEWKPLSLIAIRAGYRTDTTKELGAMAGLTTGLGINVWGQELAYAWVPYGDLGNTQYFSLLIHFGEAAKAKRNLIQYQSLKRHQTARAKQEAVEHTDPEYQQLMQLLSDWNTGVYSRGNSSARIGE